MNMAKLGELVESVSICDPKSVYGNNEFTYIDIGSVSQSSKAIENPQSLRGLNAPSRARQVVALNDVIVSTVRPNLNAVALVGEEHDGAIASTGFTILRPNASKLDPIYLSHWVRTGRFISTLMSQATGQSYPAVSDRTVKATSIPLPPLAEQKRIASILDQADALLRLRRRALDRLNTLGQAIFQEMFGNARGVKRVPISDFADVKGGKRLPKGADYAGGPTQHPYIRVSNINNLRIDSTDIKYITDETHAAIKRYTVRRGDVVISIAGTIGLTAAVPDSLNGANLTENAAKITPKKETEFDPDYLAWALSSVDAQSQIAARTGQVTIGKLALFRIEQIKVPLPEFELQRGFSSQIAELEKHITTHERAWLVSKHLFTSLQHRAFRGEL